MSVVGAAWESRRGGDFLFRFFFLLLSVHFSSLGWQQTSRGAMALLSSCYCHPRISTLKVDRITPASRHFPCPAAEQRFIYALGGTNNEFFGQRVAYIGSQFESRWSFIVGSKVFLTPKVERTSYYRKGFTICASWFTGTQIASNAFTLGTVAVLPFYFLMVVAPKSELTKRTMESNIPYVVLGVAYAYLLFLSWTPDTLRMMFASKYLLPELPGIAKMFSSEMTLASAWIHLLAVDLFAARQVFHDGLKNEIETRHSVSLCLLFCPIGILTHVITKILTKSVGDCE